MFSVWLRMVVRMHPRARAPYCVEGSGVQEGRALPWGPLLSHPRTPPSTLFSKLYLLRSRDSVARRSPWVRAPCPGRRPVTHCAPPGVPPPIPLPGASLGSPPARPLTRLSSRLATMEANLRSPASSEMRKTYSGAETWLDRWVRPGDRSGTQGHSRGRGLWQGRLGVGRGWACPPLPLHLRAGAHRTAGWHGPRSRAAPESCGHAAAGSGPSGRLGGRHRS